MADNSNASTPTQERIRNARPETQGLKHKTANTKPKAQDRKHKAASAEPKAHGWRLGAGAGGWEPGLGAGAVAGGPGAAWQICTKKEVTQLSHLLKYLLIKN